MVMVTSGKGPLRMGLFVFSESNTKWPNVTQLNLDSCSVLSSNIKRPLRSYSEYEPIAAPGMSFHFLEDRYF